MFLLSPSPDLRGGPGWGASVLKRFESPRKKIIFLAFNG